MRTLVSWRCVTTARAAECFADWTETAKTATKTLQTHPALNPRKDRRLKRLGQPPGAAETDHWVGRPRRVPLGSLPEPLQLTNPSSEKLANRGKPLANGPGLSRFAKTASAVLTAAGKHRRSRGPPYGSRPTPTHRWQSSGPTKTQSTSRIIL